MPISPLKNLVTGGAGFVGSHLVDRLMKSGEKVICLDNFFTGSKENIEHWIGHPSFELINHDVTDPIKLDADRIWHLACPASPIHYQFNPIKTAKTSFLGTYNMLGLARRLRARILFASTSEIYGNPEIHPQPEKYNGNVNPIGPRSCYDEGKRCSESLFMDYHREHKIKIKIIRIFNTYGPYMALNDGRVVSNFILQAILGKNITINGDGTQTRSFQYIDDLIAGMIMLMNTEDNFVEPINIGNPHEISMNELAAIVLKLTHSKSVINYAKLPDDDPKMRNPDISKALKKFNWKPKIDLEDGLKKTIKYFKNIIDDN